MKVTIDTQTDTIEDMKKVLHMLHTIIHKKGSSSPVTNSFNSSSYSEPITNTFKSGPVRTEQVSAPLPTTNTTAMMSMFDTPAPTNSVKEERPTGTAPDFSSFLALNNNKEEEKKEEPKIEFF